MKKIGIDITPLNNIHSGTGQYVIHLLENIIKLDSNNSYVLYTNQKPNISLDSRYKIKIVPNNFPINKYFLKKYIWEKFTLPKFIKKDNLSHFFSPYASSTQIKKINHTITIHDTIPDAFPDYLRNFFQRFYYNQTKKASEKAQKIITISNFSKAEINRFFKTPLQKIYPVYLGVDHDLYKPQSTEKGDFIFYVGGIDKRKNLASLIKSISYLKKDFPKIKLIIMASLPDHSDPLIPDYQNLIKKLSLGNSIEFTTGDDQKKAKLLAKTKLFVWPSLYEGFGLPPLEALSSGALVLSSKKASMPEILKDSVSYINNPKNPKEISEKIKEILNKSQEEKNKITENGINFSKKYSWKKCTEKILKIILS